MDGYMDFQFAVFKDSKGHFVSVTTMPESWNAPDTPIGLGELEYIVNRVAYDMQAKRLVEEITQASNTDQQKVTSERIRNALKARRSQA